MKFFYLFFILFFKKTLFQEEQEEYCSKFKEENKCLNDIQNDYSNHPIFTGRCCYDQNEKKCVYKDKINPYYWKKNNLNCFTKIEECNKINVTNKNYEKCTMFSVEPPFQCCYVGSEKYHECKALSMASKRIYKSTKFWMRNKNKDFDGNYEIICNENYLKIKFLFLFLFLSLI